MDWWNNLEPRERKMLGGGLVVIICAIFYLYLYQPQIKSLEESKESLEKNLNNLRVSGTKAGKKRLVEQKYELLEEELKNQPKNFIDPSKKINLVIDLNQLAIKTGVTLLGMKPEKSQQEDIYLKIPIRLAVNTTYQNLVQYIKEIERLNYLTRIKQVNISSKENTNGELEVGIFVIAYALNREGGAKNETED